MKNYLLLLIPALFSLFFLLLAKTAESWAALGYAILLFVSLTVFVFCIGFFFYLRYRQLNWKWWLQVLTVFALHLLVYGLLVLLIRITA